MSTNDRKDYTMTTKPMLHKIPVVRDQAGHFIHPDLLHFWTVTMDGAERCTPGQWAALEAQAGIKTSIYHLESEDIDHPAYASHFDDGNLNITAWDPAPDPGWWMIEIGDGEDGPYAVYATHAGVNHQPAATLTAEEVGALHVLSEKLHHVDDMGPTDEGWQSDKLNAAWTAVDAVLARALPGTAFSTAEDRAAVIDATSTGEP
jgi:hypothetical protein